MGTERRHSSKTKSFGEEVKNPSILWTRQGRRRKWRGGREKVKEIYLLIQRLPTLPHSSSPSLHTLRAGPVWFLPSTPQGPTADIEEKKHLHLYFSSMRTKFSFVAKVSGNNNYQIKMISTILLLVTANFSVRALLYSWCAYSTGKPYIPHTWQQFPLWRD